MSGFVKFHRKLLDWEWYQDTNAKVLFIHCLLKANYQEKNWRGMNIKRGSFVTSFEKLSSEIGLSVQQIRTAINKLKSTSEITSESTNGYTVVTVVNYSLYQDEQQASNKQSTCESTNEQQTDNKRITTTKNIKNIKKEKNISNDEFESFWLLYPKKQSKAEAFKCFGKAINKTNLETILTGLENYLAHITKEKTELKFIKHPSTWLNQECWNDDYGITSTKKTKTGRPLHGFEKQAIEEGRKVTSKLEIEMIKEWCRDNGYDETIC